jgi:hypothetical protein
MTLRSEIPKYIDGEGFVAPGLVSPGQFRGSDNGPSFSSEYYVMLNKLNQLVNQDISDFQAKIEANIDVGGLLNRHNVALGDNGQEGPDDYFGVLSACKELGITDIPRQFLKAVWTYKGALNNEKPGTWSWRSFLIRQPQLVACMVAAAFPSWINPLHLICRTLAAPFFLAAAISLSISCIGAPLSDTDARRLAWHVQNTVKGMGPMCWLASKIWLKRLYKDFPDGMQDVAKIYYQTGHPFGEYWVTE